MDAQLSIAPWRKKTCQTNLNNKSCDASMASKPVFGVSDKVSAQILARKLIF